MNVPLLSEIVLYAFNFAPNNWAVCRGQMMPIRDNPSLFMLIGTKFGGDGTATYMLPDYRTAAPQDTHYCIAVQGGYPNADGKSRDQVVGEITLLPVSFVPAAWAACNGQLLPVSQYARLFQLIGTTFGGDGQTTFATPNLTKLAPNGSAYFIATDGDDGPPIDPFIGELRVFPSTVVPTGWQACAGQTLQIMQHQPLYALIGPTFGSLSSTQFGLPDLRHVGLPPGMQYCIATAGYFPPR